MIPFSMQCPKCNGTNSPDAHRCAHCGGSLSVALLEVVRDAPLRAEMSRRGIARAETFTWRGSAHAHAAAYQAAIDAF